MKNVQSLIPSALIAAALVTLGFSLRSGIVAFKDMDRTVVVKGLAEREVKADKVTWSLKYKEVGKDPAAMYDLLATKNKTVMTFLTNGGIKPEDISINPPVIVDRQADNYGNDIMNYRYKAISIITVTSKDVDNGKGEGAEYGNDAGPVYEYTGLMDIKPEMVEEATKNARVTAQKFADDSGSKIGKIRRDRKSVV